jgi:3-dehydroquinate synthase
MEPQKVIISDDLEQQLAAEIAYCQPDRLFVLTDETTQKLCWPLVEGFDCLNDAAYGGKATLITIASGDTNKTLESVTHVWQELQRLGATRHSLMVCLGGGMVTDLGGFAASTFKRGIRLINIPTTLLSMVDASVGGKTGFNFGGLKNEIGVFRNAEAVILDTQFLRTLDTENLLSGYAEMLKHALLEENRGARCEVRDTGSLSALLKFDIEHPDWKVLQQMVAESVAVKQRIVLEDPTERGIRKALNLGHTVGHAFESFSFNAPRISEISPILHGYAVAYGLVCELYLSCVKCGFPTARMHQVVSFVREHYGRMPITCDDYPTLLELMTHDKKNTAGQINFTLLADIGDIRINQTATKHEIEEAFDFFREG